MSKKYQTASPFQDASGKTTKGEMQGCGHKPILEGFAPSIHYSLDELTVIPDEANPSPSWGNSTTVAGFRGERSCNDLGLDAGFDCFRTTHRIGSRSDWVGITPEMVVKAQEIELARQPRFSNAGFLLAGGGDTINLIQRKEAFSKKLARLKVSPIASSVETNKE